MKRFRIPVIGALALVLGCGLTATPALAFGDDATAEAGQPDAVPTQVEATQPSVEVEGDGSDRSATPSQEETDPATPAAAPALAVESDGTTLALKVSGFSSAPSNVAFAATSQGGATQWVQASVVDDGIWTASLPVPSSKIRWGQVTIAAWATIDGNTEAVATKTTTVAAPTTRISAMASGALLKLAADSWSAEPQNVAFAVTTPAGKTVWFQGIHQADGSWTASPSVTRELGSWGAQKVEVYATFNAVTASFGATKVNIGLGEVSTGASVSGATVSLSASGWTIEPANVAFEIAGPAGPSRWVQAKRQSDGSWTASVSVTGDLGAWGTYQVKTWANLGAVTAVVSRSSFTASAGTPQVSASSTGAVIALSASGWTTAPSNVAFQVRRPSGTEIWIQARRGANGSWTASTSSMAGGVIDNGTYTVTAWATHGKLTAAFGTASCDARAAGVSATASTTDRAITFTASGFAENPGNVAFEVSTPKGRILWLQARRAVDGSWAATLDAISGVGEAGAYTATAWVSFGSTTAAYASTSTVFVAPSATVAAVRDGSQIRMTATAWSVAPSNVAFEVRDGAKLTWVQGVKAADGTWSAQVSAPLSGMRQIRAWGTVGKLTAPAGSAAIGAAGSASVTAEAQGASLALTASGWQTVPSNVAFQITSPAGVERWLQGTRQEDGAWAASPTVNALGGAWGTYAVTAWATVDGKTSATGFAAVTVSAGQVQTTASASGSLATITASGWDVIPSNVAFKISKPSGEVVWMQAAKRADGAWTLEASLGRDLRAWGTFSVQTYATIDGSTYAFDSARFTFSAGSVRLSQSIEDTSFSIAARGWTRVPSNVSFRVDTPAGTSWVQGRRQTDGSWTMWASQADGFWAQGTYTITVFATIDGVTSPFGSTSFQFPRFQNDMHRRAQWYASNTNWLLMIDTAACRVGVYNGRQGNWNQVFYWAASPGKPSTPTVKGEFTVGLRGYVFGHGYSCYYWTQFYGDYLFHSVLYNQNSSTIMDGRLGQQLSHGCVRLAIENAKWINQNIPSGTKVVVY